MEKAWEGVRALTSKERFSIKFLSDVYEIHITEKRVTFTPGNVVAKDYVTIILLHYLARKLAFGKLPELSGEWVDFNELEGGEGYYPAFKKRTIDPIIKKYGADPEALLAAAGRMNAKRVELGDVSVIIYPFDEAAILIKMSKADEEFPSDASILFDKNISGILCTEDIVVLTELIVHKL
ncbi:MAG: DUF3786 domain-containing protein [Candidatus Omnitrophica bacterium]|nr:DUF3786 domain-containing protein [Candidatus Omnitrophota bacterium]